MIAASGAVLLVLLSALLAESSDRANFETLRSEYLKVTVERNVNDCVPQQAILEYQDSYAHFNHGIDLPSGGTPPSRTSILIPVLYSFRRTGGNVVPNRVRLRHGARCAVDVSRLADTERVALP